MIRNHCSISFCETTKGKDGYEDAQKDSFDGDDGGRGVRAGPADHASTAGSFGVGGNSCDGGLLRAAHASRHVGRSGQLRTLLAASRRRGGMAAVLQRRVGVDGLRLVLANG